MEDESEFFHSALCIFHNQETFSGTHVDQASTIKDMPMEEDALSKLSPEQQAALSDELKATFCMLGIKDQDFFAQNFNPKDLPDVLVRKAEIIKRNQAQRQRLEQLMAKIAQAAPSTPEGEKSDDILAAAAGALGLGAAATLVATDNTAFYQGVQPADLVEPLRTEFQSANTAFAASGQPEALLGTVYLLTGGHGVPAMTVNLTALNNGMQVKVNELTTQGILQALREGGEKLLGLAAGGIQILTGHQSPGQLISSAGQAVSSGADLAETIHNLKLKERTWKAIRQAAEAIEASYLDQLEKERQAKAALEGAWDRYYNCPTCGVAFGAEDTVCRVCGTGRPEKPLKPDPRQP